VPSISACCLCRRLAAREIPEADLLVHVECNVVMAIGTDAVAATASCVAATAGLLTLAVYIVLAVYAKRQIDEAKQLRLAHTRPFVVIELIPTRLTVSLQIRNVGSTMARQVRFEWDKWPEFAGDYGKSALWDKDSGASLFSTGITHLAPGQKIVTVFDSMDKRLNSELPMRYSVDVEYSGPDSEEESADYNESFVLDLNLFRGLWVPKEKTLTNLVDEVGKIRQEVSNWSGSEGLLRVMSSSGERIRARHDRPMHWVSIKEAYERGGVRAVARYVINEVRQKYGLHDWGS